MAGNKSLGAAKIAKEDEFYTQLTDIEKELRHYKNHFRGKTVLCNCDDPFESNFFKYFVLNFNRLSLKKLIATCYFSSPVAGQQLRYYETDNGQFSFSFGEDAAPEEDAKRPYKAVVTQVYDKTGDGGVDMVDVAELFKSGENQLTELECDGDFRSAECLTMLDEADIVVTNPPFSLFREYIGILLEYQKKFIIIGNQNATKYKEVFPYFMSNQIWLGYNNGDMAFRVPSYFEPRETRYWEDETGQKWRSLGNIAWFTNLDIRKRHEELILVRKYNSEDYPHYDNYDAIEVSKTSDIPCDYAGLMGVPITYMTIHNPSQFEIVGLSDRDSPLRTKIYTKADSPKYSDLNRCCVIPQEDGTLKSTYMRILIRNLNPEQPKGGQSEWK